MSRRISVLSVVVALVLPVIAVGQQAQNPTVPPIQAVKGVKPKPSVFKAAVRGKPLVIRSEKEAAEHFADADVATLKDRVDFKQQIMLVFAWRGSGQDRLTHTVAESYPEQVFFTLRPGRTRDLRPHVQVYALRSNVTWRGPGGARGGPAAGGKPAVAAGDAATTQPAELSAELKVLHKFLGNWQGTTTIHKAKWTPEEIRGTSATSRVSVLGGRFALSEAAASDGTTALTLATYDEERKCYRMWWFSSRGDASESQGVWDAETKTATWRSEGDDGVTSVATARYLDDNTVKWSVVVKDGQGEIGHHMEGRETRVKKLPKRKDTPAAKPAERSAEQKVLDMFVGDWKTTVTVPKAPWNPKAVSLTGASSIVRILQGRFLQDNGKGSNGMTNLTLTTYDAQRRCYRQWYFDSEGAARESKGKWDAKTRTFTMLADQVNGATATAKVHVEDNDTFEWNVVTKDREGSVVYQMKGKFTRAK